MNLAEESIIKIFNNMNFENELTSQNNSVEYNFSSTQSEPADFLGLLKTNRKVKSLASAVNSARDAQVQWKDVSGLHRSNSLHMVWETLVNKAVVLPSSENGLSILAEYFDFYSDMAAENSKLAAEPVGIVLIVLPPLPSFFMLGATVPAALAAGCSVIVHTEETAIPLFLEEIIMKAGFPEGIFNVVTQPLTDYDILENIHQTVYHGPFSSAQNFYFQTIFRSFKFFCPNKTAAFVLQSCDLNAAVAKIFHKTWEYSSIWAVSTVVVQECILQKFLDALEFEMKQFSNMNNRRSKCKNSEILEKMNNLILEAVKAGASVVKFPSKENEWGPTALINYQNGEDDLPVLKILTCRTPREGVKLLNNCTPFGISIWNEFSAQALEIASQLESPNIWVNCHGIFDAKVPVSLTGSNGNLILGGRHGILEYLSSGREGCLESKCNNGKVSRKSDILEIVNSAQKAFTSWHSNKNKKKHLRTLADCLRRSKDFSDHSQIVNYLACLTNCNCFSETNSTEEFFITYEEIPVGILSLFISREIDTKALTSLIGLPIALGNAVILVIKEENSLVTQLVNFFKSNLPKNLVNLVFGNDAGLVLASDPNVQALWIYNEKILFSTLQKLRKESSKNLKHLWIVPKDVSLHEELTWMQCIKRKIIWLPKVEKFP